jgi:DNA-binding PadR family transcriptional regulator
MKTTELKLKILQIVWSSNCYGYEIHKMLVSQGTRIDIGRLYRVLNEMLTEGLVRCRWEKSEKGPQKRVYVMADKGSQALDRLLRDAIDVIHRFYSDYLAKLPRATSIFDAFAKIATPEPVEHGIIGFLSREPSPIHEKIFASLQRRIPIDAIYAIHPAEVHLDLNLENVISMAGDYSDIPVRRNLISLLIIEGLPSSQNSHAAAEEWHRVIRENGRLLLIVPTAFFSSKVDPLSIGDFMEKMEHQNRREETVNGEDLILTLGRFFENVEKRQMLQMTLLLAHHPLKSSKSPNRVNDSTMN